MPQQPHVATASPLSRVHDHNQTVWLLWTSDQSGAQISTWQHAILTKDIHAPDSIRTHNHNNRAAADRAATEIGALPVFLSYFIVNVPDQYSRFEPPTG
jgi:hypothetical protein